MNTRAVVRTAREVFLTLGAVLGVVCIVATVAGATLGIKPLVFRSGSMSPTIHTGDLGVARSVAASSLSRGDIVSVVNSEGNRVSHRIVNIASQGPARQLTLKGDANKTADAEVYTVTRADRIVFHIPKAGYVVNAASSTAGVFVLGVFVAVMVLLIFRRPGGGAPDESGSANERRPAGRRRADRSNRPRSAARTVAAATAAGVLAVASPAAAAWTDPVPITGQALTAYTLPQPATFTCGGVGLLSVTFTWAAVTGATDYTLHYGAGGATTRTVTGTSTTLTSAISGGTAWVVANRDFGSTTWHSVASNTRSYTVAVASLCG